MHQSLENLFYEEQHQLEHQKLKSKIFIIVLLFLYGVIDGFISQHYISSTRYLGLIISLCIMFKYGQKSRNFFDFALFLIQQLFQISYLLQFQYDMDYKCSVMKIYVRGLTVTQIFFSILLGSRLYLKILSLFCFTMVSILMFFFADGKISFNMIVLMVSAILSGNHIYMLEKQSRQLFMIRFNSQQWQKSINSSFSNPILQCLYNKRENSIDLQKMNQSSRAQLKLSNEDEFRQFIRKVHVMQTQQKKKVTLEQLIFYMFEKPRFCQELLQLPELSSIFNSLLQLEAMYNNKQIQIQIFACYEEMPIVILNVNFKPVEDGLLQRKLQTRILQKIFYGQSEYLRDILVRIKMICIQKKSNVSLLLLREKFYLFYNILLDQQVILQNQMSKYNTLSMVKVSNVLKEVISILYPEIKRKNIQMYLIGKKNAKLITNEMGLMQLMITLVHQTLKECCENTRVTLYFKDKILAGIEERVLEISILSDGKFLLQKQADQLPLLNQLESQYLSNQILQTEWVVCSYLVGLLGPTQEITQKQVKGKKVLSFSLFKAMKHVCFGRVDLCGVPVKLE